MDCMGWSNHLLNDEASVYRVSPAYGGIEWVEGFVGDDEVWILLVCDKAWDNAIMTQINTILIAFQCDIRWESLPFEEVNNAEVKCDDQTPTLSTNRMDPTTWRCQYDGVYVSNRLKLLQLEHTRVQTRRDINYPNNKLERPYNCRWSCRCINCSDERAQGLLRLHSEQMNR